MAQASIEKRIRLTERVLQSHRLTSSKRDRYTQKLAYLRLLPPETRFEKGEKQVNQGGYC